MRKGTHSGRHTFNINEERKKVRQDKTYVFLSSFTKENIALSADEDKKGLIRKLTLKPRHVLRLILKRIVIFLKT